MLDRCYYRRHKCWFHRFYRHYKLVTSVFIKKKMFKLYVALGLYAIFLGILLRGINKVVTEPYMDEIFHVRQTQVYCEGQWQQWDDKITTLPGLYVLCALLASGLTRIGNVLAGLYQVIIAVVPISITFQDIFPSFLQVTSFNFSEISSTSPREAFCSLSALRFYNLLFPILTAIVIYRLLITLVPSQSSISSSFLSRHVLKTIELCVFPIHFFFLFLYYTDSVSTFFTLSAFALCLEKHHYKASLVGAYSIFCRQTNVIWLCFAVGCYILQQYDQSNAADAIARLISKPSSKLSANKETEADIRQMPLLNAILSEYWKFASWLIKSLPKLVPELFPYIAVIFGFICFIFVNQGIVVGDRKNHIASIHLPQLFYFAVFTCAMLPFHVVSSKTAKMFFHQLTENFGRLWYFIISLVMLLIVHHYTYAHPFLLSDNRHVTFTIWRQFFNRHLWQKYLYIPIYAFSLYSIHRLLNKSNISILWQSLFWLCTSMALIPTPLIEFRYYILPLILLELHEYSTPNIRLFGNILFYLMVNTAMLFIFLYRPYLWNDGSVARYMW